MRQGIADGFKLKDVQHPFIFENSTGHVFKIMVVSSGIVRIQYFTPDDAKKVEGDLQDKASEVDVKISDILSLDGNDKCLEIETPKIRLVVVLEPTFHLIWYPADDDKQTAVPFAKDLAYRSYAYDKSSHEKWHYQRKLKDNFYYGLGERTGSINLSNRRFRLERLDCMGYDAETSDPLYKFCPFYVGLSSSTKKAYGIYYNNFSNTTVDLGQELDAMWGPYTYYQSESGLLDYYMIYGPDVAGVVQDYSLITSRPRHLPPRYSLGYLASSMGYAEADDAQEQIQGFVDRCLKYQIPCDGMHLSSGYTVNADGDRCVFTWNKGRFPDPVKLAKSLEKSGIRIFANIKPWLLQQSHPDYDTLQQEKGFIWNAENDEPGRVMQWRGGRNTMGQASYIDFTSKAGYDYWKSHVKTELLKKGYLLWLDNNEFTLPDNGHLYACQVSPDQYQNLVGSKVPFLSGPAIPKTSTAAKEVGTSLQTLLMAQASYEALMECKPNTRPFLITRSATPYCNELVSQTWSGDNTTEWKTIKYNVPMGLGAGLCGMPAGYGHDVGGFAGPKPDPELFVRWVQQGIFWPRFCIHSWNNDDTVTEPWMFPEVLPTIRACMQLRYKLIPYLYTLYVSLAHRRGEPLVRPVFYDHQHDIKCYDQGFDFMLGPSLLIAPIYEPGQSIRKVYLPGNTAWYHYQTGKYYQSPVNNGDWVEVESKLTDDATPFFVKAGSMICFGKVMNNVHASDDDERRIQIFPERFDSTVSANGRSERKTFVLFEDDGDTLYHEIGGAFAEIHVWMEATETEIHVGMDIVNDGYFPYYDTVWVTCPIASETRKLVFEDQDEDSALLVDASSKQLPKIVDDETMHVYTGLKLNFKRKNSSQ